jgi:hypothetical protein
VAHPSNSKATLGGLPFAGSLYAKGGTLFYAVSAFFSAYPLYSSGFTASIFNKPSPVA